MNMHQSFLWWHNYICRNSSQSGTCTDPFKKRQPGQRSYFPVPMKTSMANNIMGTLVENKTSWKRGPQRAGSFWSPAFSIHTLLLQLLMTHADERFGRQFWVHFPTAISSI